jgi:hypothetical protein
MLAPVGTAKERPCAHLYPRTYITVQQLHPSLSDSQMSACRNGFEALEGLEAVGNAGAELERSVERETGFEPATSTLARLRSTE